MEDAAHPGPLLPEPGAEVVNEGVAASTSEQAIGKKFLSAFFAHLNECLQSLYCNRRNAKYPGRGRPRS